MPSEPRSDATWQRTTGPNSFNNPNPVSVSEQLLARERFIPARSLNLLAAAWIQFQVHDWVNHARHPLGVEDVVVPMPGGQKWQNRPGGKPENLMRIAGNKALAVDPDGTQRLFADAASHWWDASEVYGGTRPRLGRCERGPRSASPMRATCPTTPPAGGHRLQRELVVGTLRPAHAVRPRAQRLCDELRAQYRGWSDERVYQTARLIVAALIAKIHTVEWTPAILATEAIDLGLKANWNGPPANDWLTRLGIWLMDTHASVGIPLTKPDHHGVPYSLTEDFVTVYRMHPLIPDDYRFVDHSDGSLLGTRSFNDIAGAKADEELRSLGMENLLYSFGTSHTRARSRCTTSRRRCGQFEREGERIDLSVVDLVRTRRRGIPRYNDFRAGLHKPRLRDFEELSTNPESVRRMRELYRSIDDVDTMVGLFAETPPDGFGFSDTAFRIFILMASRRLQSDRFLTVDFRPEIYSPFGMDWVAQNSMTSVILRHCPDVAAMIPRGQSAFAPWRVKVRRPVRAQRRPAMTAQQTRNHPGLDALGARPLVGSIWGRRTHRVSRGSSSTPVR